MIGTAGSDSVQGAYRNFPCCCELLVRKAEISRSGPTCDAHGLAGGFRMLPPEVHGKWHSFCNQGAYRGCPSYDEQPCLQTVVKKVVFASGNSKIGEGRIGSRCLKWSQSKSKTWVYAQKGRQKLGGIRSFGFQEALWLEGSGELSGIVVSESIDHCQKLAGSVRIVLRIAVGYSRVLSTRPGGLFTSGPNVQNFSAPLPIVHLESMPSQR